MSEGTVPEVLSGAAAWAVVHGDCLEVLRGMPDCSADAAVTDPPAGVAFMGRAWDKDKGGRDEWIAWLEGIMREVMRVLRPGAHVAVWALPRTSHWTATAIENAGFEIRDSVHHVFSTGFPKSLDASKAIDAHLGAERPVVGPRLDVSTGKPMSMKQARRGGGSGKTDGWDRPFLANQAALQRQTERTGPGTDAASPWSGHGTALKPAHEVWWIARKPMIGKLAVNLLEHGCGALNIDGCRVAHAGASDLAQHQAGVDAIKARGGTMGESWKNTSDLAGASDVSTAGRWPPNIVFSHSPNCRRVGTTTVGAHPTWDTPHRATEPSAFAGDAVSKVRHGRAGQESAERRYDEAGATSFAATPGARIDVEDVDVWVCVDGCAVKELGEQSGASASPPIGSTCKVQRPQSAHTVSMPAAELPNGHGDSGTAARFFPQFEADEAAPFKYQSKPSRGEKERGLGHFRQRSAAEATDSEEGQARLSSPRTGAGRTGGVRNCHPTTKSIALMRWLTRLVTPPGGIVIDPFCGSGTGGIAALLEGFRWVGAELNDTDEEPFVSIARARLTHVDGGELVPREELRAAEPPQQVSLFGRGTP